jgi:hypothetical protein
MSNEMRNSATEEQKRILWKTIQNTHPVFAKRLAAARKRNQRFVGIEGYPKETREWLWNAITKNNPELAEQLSMLSSVKDSFQGSSLSVSIENLVEALIGDSGERSSMRHE